MEKNPAVKVGYNVPVVLKVTNPADVGTVNLYYCAELTTPFENFNCSPFKVLVRPLEYLNFNKPPYFDYFNF